MKVLIQPAAVMERVGLRFIHLEGPHWTRVSSVDSGPVLKSWSWSFHCSLTPYMVMLTALSIFKRGFLKDCFAFKRDSFIEELN